MFSDLHIKYVQTCILVSKYVNKFLPQLEYVTKEREFSVSNFRNIYSVNLELSHTDGRTMYS